MHIEVRHRHPRDFFPGEGIHIPSPPLSLSFIFLPYPSPSLRGSHPRSSYRGSGGLLLPAGPAAKHSGELTNFCNTKTLFNISREGTCPCMRAPMPPVHVVDSLSRRVYYPILSTWKKVFFRQYCLGYSEIKKAITWGKNSYNHFSSQYYRRLSLRNQIFISVSLHKCEVLITRKIQITHSNQSVVSCTSNKQQFRINLKYFTSIR